jgi:hypothetical protein
MTDSAPNLGMGEARCMLSLTEGMTLVACVMVADSHSRWSAQTVISNTRVRRKAKAWPPRSGM